LEDRAGQAERRADREARHRARQPDLVDDERVGGRPLPGQGAHDLGGAHREVPGADEQHGHAERHGQAGRGDGDGARPEAQREPGGGPHDGEARPAVQEAAAGHGAAARCGGRRTRYRNSGPPATTMTIPTCTSEGCATTRPATSAASISAGDRTAQYGNSQRRSEPVRARTRCGTISPTKMIGPQAAVAAPHSSVIVTMAAARARAGSAPSARAESSPIAIAFSGRASSSAAARPAATNGRTRTMVWFCAAASDPTVQNRMRSRDAVSRSCTALT